VVRVCCSAHLLILSVIFLPGGSFFSNLVISKIRSRRPNHVRPFCFCSSLTFSNGPRPAIFFCLTLPAIIVFVSYVVY
jgi:hypothetical protein